MARIIEAFTQFFDDNGDPLVDGLLYFYETGTNNTPKNTYSDINETIANPNPVPLDGAGRCPNIFGSGAYNVISAKSDTTQIQQFDPVTSSLGEGAFADWNAASSYQLGNIVVGPDGNYYRSSTNNNQGNDPTATPEQWEEFLLFGIWNINITYDLNDNVVLNGIIYRSSVASNSGNNPETSPTQWEANTSGQFLGSATIKAIAYNAQSIDEDITISSVQNAYSAGPITIETGRTVTIDTGGRWVIF